MKMQIVEIYKACQSSDMQVIFREESIPFSDEEELLATSSPRAALHSLSFYYSCKLCSLFRTGCHSCDKKAGAQESELSTMARPVA